jgi:Zn-dependent peptidase ImmA (M78 family)/transcriptional regulator with XRE-family HTH domain
VEIGKRLKVARESVGCTLEAAAGASGIGASSISDFENDKREPKLSQLSRLGEVYKRDIEFFLGSGAPVEAVMLWRERPQEDVRYEVEGEFRRLCEQYNRLELCTGQMRQRRLPRPGTTDAEKFGYGDASAFAREVHNEFSLGDIPSVSLKQVLEESYFVKLFYLDFDGSALSTVSEEFGAAILLNRQNVLWRRNYDLAHEVFHILTWDVFRGSGDSTVGWEQEESLANKFSSVLLMPEEPLRNRVESRLRDNAIDLGQLDDIAREFGVSLSALIYRIASIYCFKKEDTDKYQFDAARYKKEVRESDKPATLPQRYCDLAERALREGKISLVQFAKYMGISYKKAQEYIIEEEDGIDGKISIPVA